MGSGDACLPACDGLFARCRSRGFVPGVKCVGRALVWSMSMEVSVVASVGTFFEGFKWELIGCLSWPWVRTVFLCLLSVIYFFCFIVDVNCV